MTAKSRRRKFDKRRKSDEHPHPRHAQEGTRREGSDKARRGHEEKRLYREVILPEWEEVVAAAFEQGENVEVRRTDEGYSIEVKHDTASAVEEGNRIHAEAEAAVKFGDARLLYVSIDKEPGPFGGKIERIYDDPDRLEEVVRTSGALDFPSLSGQPGPSSPEEVIRGILDAKERFRQPGSYQGGPWDYLDYRPV